MTGGARTTGALLPFAAVPAGAIAVWLAAGTDPADVALFLGHQALYVLGPGLALSLALAPRGLSPAWRVGLAWPLGLLLAIGAFILCSAFDVRGAYPACPPAAALAGLAVWRLRARPGEGGPPRERAWTPRQLWVLAALCVFAFAFVGITQMARAPIPGSVPSVFYSPDQMLQLSIAAEAKHHWPLTNPQISGQELYYHYFANVYAASISDVTGIDVPIVVLRLYLLPLIAAVVGLAALAGRAVGGPGWAGPLTAALVVGVSELDLSIPEVAPFFGVNDIWLAESPSYVLGLVFFLPAVALAAGLVDDRVLGRVGLRRGTALLAFAALLAGLIGAKAVGVPLIAAGLALFGATAWLAKREFRPALAPLLIAAVVFVAGYAVMYAGDDGGLALGIGHIYEVMPGLITLERVVPDSFAMEAGFWTLGSIAATLLHFLPPLIGLYWVLRPGLRSLRPAEALLLCVLVAGLPAWLFLSNDNGDNNYFTAYGVIACLPVAGMGLVRGASEWREAGGDARRTAAPAAGLLASFVALAMAGWYLSLNGSAGWAYALVYGGVLAALLLALAWSRANGIPGQAVAIAAAVVLAAASLDLVLDGYPEAARSAVNGKPLYDTGRYGIGFTPEEMDAAVWARENLDEDAVIAVSDWSDSAQAYAPVNSQVPAFAERRTLYMGWAYATRSASWSELASGEVEPYPERARARVKALRKGNAAALAELRERYGVTDVWIDVRSGEVHPRVMAAGTVVFSNDAVELLQLDG